MNIHAILSFKSNTLPHRHSAGVIAPCFNNGLQQEPHLPYDSYESKKKKIIPPNLREQQEAKKLKQELYKEYQIAYKEALREKFVNPHVRRAILNGKVKETTLNKIVNTLKYSPDLLSELFLNPPGGGLMICVPDRTMKKVCEHLPKQEYFVKMALTRDANGKSFIEKATSSQIKIFNEQAKRFPKILKAVYLRKNQDGQLPAHYLQPEALDSMNIALKEFPDVIKRIYTTTDKNGNTPAHKRFYYGQAVIAKALENQIPTAHIVYNTKNAKGEFFDHALTLAEHYQGAFASTWDYILQNF